MPEEREEHPGRVMETFSVIPFPKNFNTEWSLTKPFFLPPARGEHSAYAFPRSTSSQWGRGLGEASLLPGGGGVQEVPIQLIN